MPVAGRLRDPFERFVARGTEGLPARQAALLRRFNTFTLIGVFGACYSLPFHVFVVGMAPVTIAFVVIDVVCGGAFWVNRRVCLADPTPQRLVRCTHVMVADAALFMGIPMILSGRDNSPLVLYLAIVPAIATYLLGLRAGVVWGAIIGVVIGLTLYSDNFADLPTYARFPEVQAYLTLVVIFTLMAMASRRVFDHQVDTIEDQADALSRQNLQLERQSMQLADARDRAIADSRSHQAKFEAGFESSPIGLALVDIDGRFVRANDSLCRMLRFDRTDLEGKRFADITHPDDITSSTQAMRELKRGDITTHDTEKRYLARDGEVVWARVTVSALHDDGGAVDGFYTQVLDITQEKAAEADLRRRATHDALTGLANRTRLLERMAALMDDPAADDEQVAVLFIDIDQFKILNDSLGHGVGDQLLLRVGRRLQERLHGTDTIARLGGDEFAVLASVPAGSTDSARRLADEIHQILHEPFMLEGQEVSSTVSIGIVTGTEGAATPEDLLRHADAAMYRAKAEGRATSRVFDEAMRESLDERFELVRLLSAALDHDELEVHYQPEIDLENGEILAVEALLRWRHPVEGLLSAGRFIDIAEETGLIVSIGSWALAQAVLQAARWPVQANGRRIHTRINLSANQLAQDDLAKVVQNLLAESQVEPASVCFELTETALIETGALAMANVEALRSLGSQLAIDDFGTGYSSLTYLKQIPADALKIDLSFVQGLSDDERDRLIVRSVISMATDLGFDLVAEGVETEEQARLLREYGCRRAQGWLWHKALPASEVEALLNHN